LSVMQRNVPWPFFTRAQERLAQHAWRSDPEGCSSRPRRYAIPNVVHQPWLHGGKLRWEHLLGMLSVRFVLRPDRYILYYDKAPKPTEEWRCACEAFAIECRQRSLGSVWVPGTGRQRRKRLKMYHWPDMMRLELLIEHGGIFIDHDAFVVRSLDALRLCPEAPVLAGFEQASPTTRKLNPGVLFAVQNSTFLRMCVASWANYSTAWDHNCCEVSYQIYASHPTLVQPRADIGPLPRFRTRRQYNDYISRARVVHTTALSNPWRRKELKDFGVIRRVLQIVLDAVNTSALTALQKTCIHRTTHEIYKQY